MSGSLEIQCASCQRTFTIDKTRLGTQTKLRCECQQVIDVFKSVVAPGLKRKLGNYEVLRRLGMGGMGEILLARQSGAAGFERLVCIKKMLPHLSLDRQFIGMLIQEAKLTVSLQHPNIVQIYDLAQDGDEYYIAMEYIDGIDLGRLIDACARADVRLPVPVAVHLMLQTLRALHYAHTRAGPDGQPLGLIHRDMTPQNVLLGRNGVAKLTDFGIAKAAGQISSTRPGMVKGKLGYLAPEQITGTDIDRRVDVFTAGILLWEMLARRRLFKAVDLVDSFRLVAQCQIPSIRALRDDVSPELEAVLLRALAATPAARYQSAGELANDLERVMMPASVGTMEEEARAFFAAHSEFFDAGPVPQPEQTDSPTLNLPSSSELGAPAEPAIDPASLTPVSDLLASVAPATVEEAARANRITSPSPPPGGLAPAQPAARSRTPLLVTLSLLLVALAATGGLVATGVIPAAALGLAAATAVEPAGGPPPANPAGPADDPGGPGKTPRPPEPEVKPARLLKELSAQEITRRIAGRQQALGKCVIQHAKGLDEPTLQIQLKLTIDSSGKVSEVLPLPPHDGASPIGSCMAGVLRRTTFPAHRGPAITLVVPMQFDTRN